MRMVGGLNLAGNNNPKWLKEMKDIKSCNLKEKINET